MMQPLDITSEMEGEIRSVAHKIWEDEGKQEGLAEEHWARACAIVAAANELQSGADAPNWLQKTSAPDVVVTTSEDAEETSLANTIDQLKRRVASRSAA